MAAAGQGGGTLGGRVAVRDIDNLDSGQVKSGRRGNCLQPGLWRDQHRHDQAGIAGVERRSQRRCIAGMHHRAAQWRQVTHGIEQAAHAVAVTEAHLGQGRTRAHDAFLGCDHAGFAVDDHRAILVAAGAGKRELASTGIAAAHFHGNAQGVADMHRGEEAQGLAQIDRAGAGQACAEQARDQRRPPHAMRKHALRGRCRSRSASALLRAVIPGNHREKLHVAGIQRALGADAVADCNLREEAIAHETQIVLVMARAG